MKKTQMMKITGEMTILILTTGKFNLLHQFLITAQTKINCTLYFIYSVNEDDMRLANQLKGFGIGLLKLIIFILQKQLRDEFHIIICCR